LAGKVIDEATFFPLFFLSILSKARSTSASELRLSIKENLVTFLHFLEQATFSSPATLNLIVSGTLTNASPQSSLEHFEDSQAPS
jgi:hypothetical protein